MAVIMVFYRYINTHVESMLVIIWHLVYAAGYSWRYTLIQSWCITLVERHGSLVSVVSNAITYIRS